MYKEDADHRPCIPHLAPVSSPSPHYLLPAHSAFFLDPATSSSSLSPSIPPPYPTSPYPTLHIFTMLLRHLREVPSESRSWIRLWWPVWVIGGLGIARGLDEGIVSGVINQASFKKSFDFEADSSVENNIASMLQAGSIVGSVLAFAVS